VIVRDVRRSKQYVPRKELQKRAKQEYIRRIYEVSINSATASDHAHSNLSAHLLVTGPPLHALVLLQL
jgi:hypothetical protein